MRNPFDYKKLKGFFIFNEWSKTLNNKLSLQHDRNRL